ncbi:MULTISPECIES: NADP-dependent oxidoreductase [unclassified Kitasatospora]|uniref:NADP-dependent oxidoreductase n=1 Tax=unclassified Kitasatospora TaxID=2633591 RepID=UPI00070F1ED0|nr:MULTISPECIES: NADP-dependent oxidoreductase [unclassified Kitasatospora]KQV04741.1 NADPH:quinone reductase [Kitasatospora sp. Root107]KRB60734.1 NADPH:quinone reductase [Kitasatospora sp. Root187]
MSKAFGFVAYGGPEHQEFLDRPVPVPGPGQLLIAVHAAGVNAADWKIRQGLFGTAEPTPRVLGLEAAGVVQVLGEGVTGLVVGDPVFGPTPGGAFAEHTLLESDNAAQVPDDVSFTQAATLSVAAATAYDAVEQLGLTPGQVLLVLGVAGGVGSAAAQIAAARGIKVLGTASDQNREYVASLGAAQIAYGEGVAGRVKAAAPGGVDGILDLVGGEDARAASAALRPGGRLVSTADPVTAVALGGEAVRRRHGGEVLTALAALVANGGLDPHVSETFTLEHAAEAMLAVESGHARGKCVIEIR